MNSKNVVLSAAILGFAFAGAASADTSSGTLAVTGTIASSISLTIESAGGASQTGMGTNAATTALGSVSKFGTAPTGFTLTKGVADWTLASTVGVKVIQANSASATYTLRAQLATPPTANVAWSVNSLAVTDAGLTDITATGAYDTTPTYPWTIVIADSVAAGSLGNTINFVATSN